MRLPLRSSGLSGLPRSHPVSSLSAYSRQTGIRPALAPVRPSRGAIASIPDSGGAGRRPDGRTQERGENDAHTHEDTEAWAIMLLALYLWSQRLRPNVAPPPSRSYRDSGRVTRHARTRRETMHTAQCEARDCQQQTLSAHGYCGWHDLVWRYDLRIKQRPSALEAHIVEASRLATEHFGKEPA